MSKERVRDLASALSKVAFVKQECRVRELVEVFQKMNMSSGETEPLVLVADEQGRTAGMVTVPDMLQALEPEFLKPEYNCEVYWPGLFVQRCRNIADKPVSAIMRPPVTVDGGDTLMRAANLVRRHRVNTVLVLDGDQVVGTLSVRELFKAMADAVA